MNSNKFHLLDLPNEILFFILKKLCNMNVLYSFFGINNQRFDLITQDQTFSNTLNFISKSSNNEIFSISDSILDRFCSYILPRIHHNIQSLTLESTSLEHIFLAANYPKLTELQLFNFNQDIFSRYFKDDSSLLIRPYKQQLTKLILISNERKIQTEYKKYTLNVYVMILILFENLKSLTILPSCTNNYPPLSLEGLPSTTFFSSTLTKLSIKIYNFYDCLAILDGRLKQLNTLIVETYDAVKVFPSHDENYNKDDLPNLKYFSFICYTSCDVYDEIFVPLFRRMICLEQLTLYLLVQGRSAFIDGIDVQNKILIHMLQLHTFNFYIATEKDDDDSTIRPSNNDIQRTLTNMRNEHVIGLADYFGFKKRFQIFSLPFQFHRLESITNNFPKMMFNSVTHLQVWDSIPFKHEFFVRISRSFPLIKYLMVRNLRPPIQKFLKSESKDDVWCSIVKYDHLISLDLTIAAYHYIEHFLDDTKTQLPQLTKLKTNYNGLLIVTENFTKDTMRNNCSKVKQLIVDDVIVYSKEFYDYFPSFSNRYCSNDII